MAHPLKLARTAKDLTQKELGEMCGLCPSTICRIEHGLNPQIKHLQALAKALDVADYRQLLPEVEA